MDFWSSPAAQCTIEKGKLSENSDNIVPILSTRQSRVVKRPSAQPSSTLEERANGSRRVV